MDASASIEVRMPEPSRKAPTVGPHGRALGMGGGPPARKPPGPLEGLGEGLQEKGVAQLRTAQVGYRCSLSRWRICSAP